MSLYSIMTLLGVSSVVMFVGSLLAVPWLIGRMEADYFLVHWQQLEARRRRHPLVALALLGARNGAGLCLVLAGIAMLVLPGQGLLTLFIGLCLMDLPGKRRLIQRLVSYPQVQRALNWVRRKRGKADFAFPDAA